MLNYSDSLVALVRTIDSAYVASNGVDWYLGDLESDAPETYHKASEFAPWVRRHVCNLYSTLPGLKAVFLERLRQESVGIEIHENPAGQPIVPVSVVDLLAPVANSWFSYKDGPDSGFGVVKDLPSDVKPPETGYRIVLFDGEGYIVPPSIHDSVIEVWFRRMFSYDLQNHEPYPLYLIKRAYGWQAYGSER